MSSASVRLFELREGMVRAAIANAIGGKRWAAFERVVAAQSVERWHERRVYQCRFGQLASPAWISVLSSASHFR